MLVLVFEIEGERYALPLTAVREIVRAVAVVPLPGAPAIMEGLVDVHGEVAAVVNLRAVFGLARRAPQPEDHMIVIGTTARLLVVRVDRVTGVEDVDVAGVPARLPAGSLEGWGRLPDGLVLVHDAERFVSAREAAALDARIAESEAR